jgi:hypothetical protein
MSQLSAALRKKFKSPREVMRRLGLDESLLDEARAEAAKLANDAKLRRGARDNHVDEMGPHHRYSDAERTAGKSEHPVQFDGAIIEKVLSKLRELGLGDGDLRYVAKMLGDAMSEEAGAEMPTDDELPAGNALNGGFGGRMSEKKGGMAGDRRLVLDARSIVGRITVGSFGTREPPPRPAPGPKGGGGAFLRSLDLGRIVVGG